MSVIPAVREHLQVFRTDTENVIAQILSDRSVNYHNIHHDP